MATTAFRHPWLLWAAAWCCAMVLAGCGSAPMVPPASAPMQPLPGGMAVTPPPTPPPPVVPAAPPVPPPYGAAVAAHFPDPAVVYRTPGLQERRNSFTSQSELENSLRSLTGAQAHILIAGRSQNGVPIEALLFSSDADPSPDAVRASGKPTVLLIGQQHGDEPAGAEALLVTAQELAHGTLLEVLDRINVIVLPRANPDGAQAQQHATANGIDLDADHLLLRTPEAQALALLVRDYQPLAVIDAQEYPVSAAFVERYGMIPRDDALLQYAMTGNLPEFIGKASEEWFREPMVASLKQQGLSTQWYYTPSLDSAERKLSMGSPQAGNARNAFGLTNAVSVLVASRGAGLGRLHLQRRVHTQVTAIAAALHQAAARGADLMKLRQYVDAEVSAKACQGPAVIEAAPTPSEYTLQMIDPATATDRAVTVNWDSALELREIKRRTRPCGYWLAADQNDAVDRLRRLGLRVSQISAVGVMQGESFAEPANRIGSAAHEQQLQAALLDVLPGSYYVPLSQPLANLAIAALEPDAPGSYVAFGVIRGADKLARIVALPGVKMMAIP